MSTTETTTEGTTESGYQQERPSGRHQVSIGHLVMGIALLGIVGVWALVQTEVVTGDDIRWLLPIPWVLAGVVGLVATAVTGPRRHAVRQTGWAGPPPESTPESTPETNADVSPDAAPEERATALSETTDPEEKP